MAEVDAFLTEEELRFLTKRRQRKLQREVLALMGIDHLVRPDGSLVVSRARVEQLLGLEGGTVEEPEIKINWD